MSPFEAVFRPVPGENEFDPSQFECLKSGGYRIPKVLKGGRFGAGLQGSFDFECRRFSPLMFFVVLSEPFL